MRIVPSESPVANLANLYREPPAILSTRLVTEAVTRVLTLTTEVTTPLTVTLGAREVLTEIIQPTTTVIIVIMGCFKWLDLHLPVERLIVSIKPPGYFLAVFGCHSWIKLSRDRFYYTLQSIQITF